MLRYAIAFALLATPCLAQQAPTPNEQALSNKLMQELQEGVSCNVQLITTKAELTKALARLRELEPKPAEAKPEQK